MYIAGHLPHLDTSSYCDGLRSACLRLRAGRWPKRRPVGSEKDDQHRQKMRRSDGGKSSEMRYQSGGAAWFILSSCLLSSGIALIGIHSSVSRSSSSSNYILLSFLLFVVSRFLAFILLFWLGCAVDHRPHTPTTTFFNIFQHSRCRRLQASYLT